jgi:homoserine kinase type II
VTRVHLLWHVRSDDEHAEDAKLIGVYSSPEAAATAVTRLKAKAGFTDHPNGFQTDEYAVDEDHWTEGFVEC